MECTSSLVKLAGTEVYECFLTKTIPNHTWKDSGNGNGQEEKAAGACACPSHRAWHHFIWRNTIQPRCGWKKRKRKERGCLIREYNRNDASSVAHFFEREQQQQPASQTTPMRESEIFLCVCGTWLAAKGSILQSSSSFVLFRDLFLHAVPESLGGFNPREGDGGAHRQIECSVNGWMSFLEVLACVHYKWFVGS